MEQIDEWLESIIFYRNSVRKEVIIFGGIAIGAILMWIYWKCLLCYDKPFQQLLKDSKKRGRWSETKQKPNVQISGTPLEGTSPAETNVEEIVVIAVEREESSEQTRKHK